MRETTMSTALNYCQNYHRLCQSPTAASDFRTRLAEFLTLRGLAIPVATQVATDTCAKMHGLKYHTPVHILSLFDWAKELAITLEPWQTLALWFHDVIYDLEAPPLENENQSARFTTMLLSGHVDPDLLTQACAAIKFTGYHFEKDNAAFPEGVPLVLDLDVCMFAWDRSNYAAAAQMVAAEYQTIYSPHDYAKGRRHFLNAFKDKGFIYRTDLLKPYEAAALENINWEIDHLKHPNHT